MLKIKKLVLIVALTLKGYGLPIGDFYKIEKVHEKSAAIGERAFVQVLRCGR